MNKPLEDRTAPESRADSPIVVNLTQSSRWWPRLLLVALVISLLMNLSLYSAYRGRSSSTFRPSERFHSGDTGADAKLVLLEVSGTIIPPFTEKIIKAIEAARDDEKVKGVVLAVDSPGGLVPDSHQIYVKLKELSEQKPMVVAMQRMAASGGYYIAMGGGENCRIFAEPTTWTGSIGVIIPRFNAAGLAEKVGLEADPLKTGPFKDALSPFRDLSEAERTLWMEILDDAYNRFINVIADNRSGLDYDAAKNLATGQIYTATQAKENGLIDEIGYTSDAIDALKTQLGLEKARVVKYQFPVSLTELVIGSMEANDPSVTFRDLVDATVPHAMYLCSWAPAIGRR